MTSLFCLKQNGGCHAGALLYSPLPIDYNKASWVGELIETCVPLMTEHGLKCNEEPHRPAPQRTEKEAGNARNWRKRGQVTPGSVEWPIKRSYRTRVPT